MVKLDSTEILVVMKAAFMYAADLLKKCASIDGAYYCKNYFRNIPYVGYIEDE